LQEILKSSIQEKVRKSEQFHKINPIEKSATQQNYEETHDLQQENTEIQKDEQTKFIEYYKNAAKFYGKKPPPTKYFSQFYN